MSDRTWREVGLYAACGSVGHCGGRNADKSALDQLPEVVFIRDLYRNGMGVSVCIPGTVSHSFPGSIFVAACRRSDLYCRRCDLCLKLPVFNAKHSQFGSHEVFHLFVMAGSICHFVFMYQYVA